MKTTNIERCSIISTFVAVPAILALLSAIQLAVHSWPTEFLVLPPLAVVTYLLFRQPSGPWTCARSIVVLPCAGAICGELAWRFFGMTPLGIGVATLAVLALQLAIRATMPPALALAVLAMLLHVQGPAYALGVLQATAIIFVAFHAWRRFVLKPIAGIS